MSDLKYLRIIEAVTAVPWAILPGKLAVIRDLLAFRVNGGELSADDVRERLSEHGTGVNAANGRGNGRSSAGVAVIPILGTIIPRANLLTESSGAVSVQRITAQLRQALADPDVDSIILDIDSPGGQVGGVEELSQEIYEARERKPITAVANTLAASAAYWIGSAASEFVVTPTGEAGSIGVYAMHEDLSRALEQEGVDVSLISAGEYKVEANPFEPLDDEARSFIQSRVDEYYDMFTAAVARNRGVNASDVRGGFGQGRVVGARQAVRLGMADRVATFDQVMTERLRANGNERARDASIDFRRRRLRQAAGPGADATGQAPTSE